MAIFYFLIMSGIPHRYSRSHSLEIILCTSHCKYQRNEPKMLWHVLPIVMRFKHIKLCTKRRSMNLYISNIQQHCLLISLYLSASCFLHISPPLGLLQSNIFFFYVFFFFMLLIRSCLHAIYFCTKSIFNA